MKKILKLSVLPLLFFSIMSCSNDDDNAVASPSNAPELISPEDGTAIVLDPLYPNNPAITFVWNHAAYGVETEVDYVIEVAAAGTEFANPVVAGASTTNRVATLTVQELNGAAISAGLAPFEAGELDVRVTGTLGDNVEMPMVSNTVTITVTPYSTELPRLAVVGNHQGWAPDAEDVPELAAAAFGDPNYEGYVWLDGEYKFLMPDAQGNYAWGNTDYGDDGTFTGILKETDEVNANASVAGYYRIKANIEDLTYSAQLTNWGLIGSATAATTGGDGWAADADMTYDPATGTWSITIDLAVGEIKFRANDDWGLNYGDDDADASLEEGGANIVIPAAGNYTITLDLSNPRAYTYTVQQN